MKSFSPHQFPLPPHQRPPRPSSLQTFVCDLCQRNVYRSIKRECQECGVCGCSNCWEKEEPPEFQQRIYQPLLILFHNQFCPECFLKQGWEHIQEEERKLEEARRQEEARAEEERKQEQEILRGGEQVTAEQKRHEQNWNRAQEEETLIRCDYCKNEEPKEYFETCNQCGARCCYQCISVPDSMSYRSLEFYSAIVSGKFCPFCFRLKKEELEEEWRQRNRAQTENEEENM